MAKELNAKSSKNGVKLGNGSALTEDELRKFRDASLIVLKKEDNVVKIELTWRMIAIIALGIVLFFYSSQIISVVAIIFFAFILTSTVLPVYKYLLGKGVKKGLAIFVVYFGLVLVILSLIALVLIPFITEFVKLVDQLPAIFARASIWLETAKIPLLNGEQTVIKESLNGYISKISKDLTTNIIPFLSTGFDTFWAALGTIASLFGGLVTILTALTISVYMLIDHEYLTGRYLLARIDVAKRNVVKKLLADVEWKLGRWVWGEVALMLVIGFLNWIVLSIFRVPFALPLAVIAGLLEIVPNVGPIVAAILAFIFALVSGGLGTGIFVAIGAFVIQQLENNYIVPKIMSSAVDVRPLILLIGMLFGFALGNVMGGLVAVPILGVMKIFYDFYIDMQRLKAKSADIVPEG